MNALRLIIDKLKTSFIDIPNIRISDIIDILFVAYFIYKLISWIKNTRAWTLFKGILVIGTFTVIAYLFQFNTILWIITNTLSVGITAIIIVFQPELRRALEQLGRGGLASYFMNFDDEKKIGMTFQTIDNIARAVEQMAAVKTGALIVIEKDVKLGEYERTGIMLDADISSQLLINIFEHNTPLHDGAIIVKENKISSATCYLPLTDSLELSKDLGTRHRAAIGITEVSDAIVIVVSEETGHISLVKSGNIVRNVNGESIKKMLSSEKKRNDKKNFLPWKGRKYHEKN